MEGAAIGSNRRCADVWVAGGLRRNGVCDKGVVVEGRISASKRVTHAVRFYLRHNSITSFLRSKGNRRPPNRVRSVVLRGRTPCHHYCPEVSSGKQA